jgi:hypothetical protein
MKRRHLGADGVSERSQDIRSSWTVRDLSSENKVIHRSDELAQSRGIILVASLSDSFQNILGHMIGRCGFTPAYCGEDEPASLSLSRTRPGLVVCDGDLPDAAASRLITEVTARRIPLLVSPAFGTSERDLGVPVGAHRLTFPLGQIAFGAMVDELLEPSTLPGAGDADPLPG